MKFFRFLSIVLLTTLLTMHKIDAQQFVQLKSVTELTVSTEQAALALDFKILRGYHIQAHQPDVNWMIPTRLEINSTLKLKPAKFPPSWDLPWPGEEEPMKVYKCLLNVSVPFDQKLEPGSYRLEGTLYYQACDRVKCYFPRTLNFEITLKVVAPVSSYTNS